MEIYQLEYFLAVERCRSFSAAALDICVSQSTLSQQIKRLEDELGVMLFVRGPRSVRLTPAGEDFVIHAKRILAEIQRSREAMHMYTNFNKGGIKIGAIPTIAYLGFNKIISNFMKNYPGIRIEIHEANTDDLLKLLQEKKINVAFITSPYSSDSEIDFYPFVTDRVAVMVSNSHPLANEIIIDLSDLSQENFLMIKSSSGYRQALIHACNQAGFEPRIILESSHVEMLRGFVEEGIGIALMGYRIAQCISSKSISIIPIRQVLVDRKNGLAIPRYRRLPLTVQLFRDFTLKYIYSESWVHNEPRATDPDMRE
jgi:LysR family transcriptional activator of glutamate synthase operon